MKYCDQCGSKLSDGALFCENCGNRLIENQPIENIEAPQENQFQNNAVVLPQNTFPQPTQLKPKKNRKKPIIAASLVLVAAIAVGILFGKSITTQIFYIVNPGVTATFEAQIPEGETEQQKTENMNRISYMTKIRLIYLGCSKATVSVDNNVVTIKHIPKKADISKVKDYITSSSYTAEIQDPSGKTIVDNAEFSYALVLPGVRSDTQYDISIGLTTYGEKVLKEAIKPFAAQEEEQNNIVLIANGKKIATLHISAEEAKNGIVSSMLDFVVPTENKIDLTHEELIKALNSCGKLPYALSFIEEILSGKEQTDSSISESGATNDLHPDRFIGTYTLTDATLNAGISACYSESFTDYTITFYKDGTYSEQGTIFFWNGTDEGKKYGHNEQINEQGKWEYHECSETSQPLGLTVAVEGIINMGENKFLKNMGAEDDPMFYTFHFYIAKDTSAFDAYSIQGNYTRYYKKVS